MADGEEEGTGAAGWRGTNQLVIAPKEFAVYKDILIPCMASRLISVLERDCVN